MIIKLYQCGGEKPISEYPIGLGYLKSNCNADITIVNDVSLLKNCDYIGLSTSAWGLKESINILNQTNIPVILGGQGVLWDEIKNYKFKHIIYGDGEISLNKIINGNAERLLSNKTENLDDLNFPDRGNCGNVVPIITSRGCPFHCLHGDTVIETIEGQIAIKELVGRNIKVLSRNKQTGIVEYANAYNICKTQSNAQLIRVLFDDGTFIDCTPDHKFMTFKNGNQHSELTENETEAKDLQYKQSVRAVRYEEDAYGYIDVVWGRRKRAKMHRLVMEGMLNRKLSDSEIVHHKNPNWKGGIGKKKKSRIKEINHKVISITYLNEKSDVYCMEVPGYDWFFANRVLVHNCNFCSSKAFWGKPRYHSADYFISEVQFLLMTYPKMKELYILDDLFIGHKERFWKIYDIWMKLKLNKRLKLKSFVRSNLITIEIAQAMKNMGFKKIRFGGESGSDRMLKLLNKGATVEDHQGAINTAKLVGLPISASFMYDLPNETDDDRRLTQEFINKNKDKLQVEGWYKFMSFPGIPMWDGTSPLNVNMKVR